MLERGGCAVFELLRAMAFAVRALCQRAPRPASIVMPVPSTRLCCPVADHRPPTLRAVEHTTGEGPESVSHFRVRAVAFDRRPRSINHAALQPGPTEVSLSGNLVNKAKVILLPLSVSF